MAAEAGGASFGLVQVSHHGILLILRSKLVTILVVVTGIVGLEVRVHRGVTDGGAEARLLMPNPEARTSGHNHNSNDTDDDGPLLLALLGGFGIRSFGRFNLLFFSHGYPLSFFFPSLPRIPCTSWRGCQSILVNLYTKYFGKL